MKKYIGAAVFTTLALLVLIFYSLRISYQKPSCPLTMPLSHASPEHLEIAWDLHSVFLKKSVFNMITHTILYNFGKITTLFIRYIQEYIHYLFTGKIGRTLQLIWDMQMLYRARASGQAYAHLLQAYHPGWEDIILTITAQYKPTEDMQQLIKDINALGYTQRIATNADQLLYDQQAIAYPEIFSYLQGGKIVNYVGQPPWAKKPSLRFFQEYQKMYNPDNAKKIIFIDNSATSVTTAAQAGMIGIVFHDAAQLRKKLIALGIPLTTKLLIN